MEEKKLVSPQASTAGAVIIFFALLFAFSKWGPAIPFSVLSQSKGEPMIVTGTGKTTVIPDIAKINVGIEEQGTDLKQVQTSVNNKSQSLTSALKKLGIDEKDIKTNSYNIYPQSDYQVRPAKITGYSISVNYEVTVKDIEKINDVLSSVTPAGANTIGGVSFDLSDSAREKAMEAARNDAVDNAKTNAQSLARASGVTLGKIINVSESQNSSYPRPMYAAAGKMAMESSAVPAPDVVPGTAEVNLTVSLSYEVR